MKNKTSRIVFLSIVTLTLSLSAAITLVKPTASATPLDATLVAHWKLDETTGTTVADSANSNSGTTFGNPIHVTGKLGRALSFDGAQSVDIDSSDDDFHFTFSLSFWIKTTDTDADAIISDSRSGFKALICDGGKIGIQPYENSSTHPTPFCGTKNINDGQWHLIVITRDQAINRFKLYIDSAIDNGDFWTSPDDAGVNAYNTLTAKELAFNRTRQGNPGGFTGRLDDVRMYSAVLTNTADEGDIIGSLYNLPVSAQPLPPYIEFVPPMPVGTTTVPQMTYTFVSQAETTLTCDLDGHNYASSSCASPLTLTNLTNGTHELHITATDEVDQHSTIGTLFVVKTPTANPDSGSDEDQDGPAGITSSPSSNDDQDGPAGVTSSPSNNDDQDSQPPAQQQNNPPAQQAAPLSGGSSSGGGGFISRTLASSAGIVGGGQVLGATASCGIYLPSPMILGGKNDPKDVEKLHAFLNETIGSDLPINGIFNKSTVSAIKKFQLAHKDSIITPWIKNGKNPRGIATGYVGATTLWTINTMVCPELQLPQPVI